jgi:threonylcarbamoyladenosine tRNA methylthiotransferase MtaB
MRVFVYTLGCKLNQCESEAIADAFTHEGFSLVTSKEIADIYIVNTCTVTTKAEQKARRMIRKFLHDNREAVVITTGCYAQMEEELLSSLGERVVVISLDKKPLLLQLASKLQKRLIADIDLLTSIQTVLSEEKDDVVTSFDYDAASFSLHSRSFLKIQDGCDNSCGYCRVTIARGDSVSLPIGDVLQRCLSLQESGYKEIVLTGVNISAYKDGDNSLEHLLEKILEVLSPHMRIRLSSLEPDCFSEGLLKVLENPQIQPHFHLPLQSLSDRVLDRVGRHYHYDVVCKAVTRLREVKDNPFIAADMITGLPSENEEEFNESFQRLKDLEITQLHVFPFSPRPQTPLWGAKDKAPEYLRDERAAQLRTLSTIHYRRYINSFLGKEVEVLIEKESHGVLHGICANYIKVVIEDAPESISRGSVILAQIEQRPTSVQLVALYKSVLYS